MNIWNRIRDFFTFNVETGPIEMVPNPIGFKTDKTPSPNAARIHEYKNGTFALVREDGNEVVAKYQRRRDAVRGAERRGLEIK